MAQTVECLPSKSKAELRDRERERDRDREERGGSVYCLAYWSIKVSKDRQAQSARTDSTIQSTVLAD
jgi:hypothetical protein